MTLWGAKDLGVGVRVMRLDGMRLHYWGHLEWVREGFLH